MRFDGDRHRVLALTFDEQLDVDDLVALAEARIGRAIEQKAVVGYGFADERVADAVFDRLGFTSLGSAPVLVRPLRLSATGLAVDLPAAVRALLPNTALVLPFGRGRRSGVREILTNEPRVSRLWDRFSIDVVAAVERNAIYLDRCILEHLGDGERPERYRALVFEDGDRYVVRALCLFRVAEEAGRITGHVTELLHDRSLAGMRAASHLLGLALREMSDAGAETAIGWSLHHSGSYPIYARHAFLPSSRVRAPRFGVRAFDPRFADAVGRRESWYLSLLDAGR